MSKIIAIALLFFAVITNSNAAVWVKLQEKKDSNLMLDKQSVLEVDKLKRAWLKVVYKTPQTNIEVAEKTYNLSKLLWFFDCATQKAATSQVFQYSNDELIYSAAVDSKAAKFIEPVPETDIDVAMRYVCGVGVPAEIAAEKHSAATAKPTEEKVDKEEVKTKPEVKPALSKAKVATALVATAEKSDKVAIKSIVIPKPNGSDSSRAHWGYEGKEGPENWGKMSPEFITCELGRNQSPINIDTALHADLKPLKVFQRFPANDIVNNGHTIQVNFKPGNILALDSVLYQMKQVHFHSPSENTIHGKSYPLEAHFVHADAKGNLAVLAVMFEEGKANEALGRLWQQMPSVEDAPVFLKNRVLASDLVSQNNSYYRFSGSLTTPPCSEGVSWVVLKTPMTASLEQIDAFKKAIQHQNSRPVQDLNGRLVVE